MKNQKGFSLIEMLIVVAILVALVVLGWPSLTSHFRLSFNATARKLGNTIKKTAHYAVMTGRVYRIVYDLDSQEYWVESGPKNFLIQSSTNQKKSSSPQFQLEKEITQKKVRLPKGICYEKISTQQNSTPISKGQAYTHFFPHGFGEVTQIDLKNQKQS